MLNPSGSCGSVKQAYPCQKLRTTSVGVVAVSCMFETDNCAYSYIYPFKSYISIKYINREF